MMKLSLPRSRELGRSGVPTYVFYLPGQAAITLPEVLTPGIVFGALDQLRTRPKEKQEAGLKRDNQALMDPGLPAGAHQSH